ncbi:MAG TPA: hypothetical protein VF834_03725, partial [Streptosporangiaceae bacterium]
GSMTEGDVAKLRIGAAGLSALAISVLALAPAAWGRPVSVPPPATGAYSKISMPGAAQTSPEGNNDRGTVVGCFRGTTGPQHAFVERGGTFARITDPAAGRRFTCAAAISDTGVIVGDYIGKTGVLHGFVDRSGKYSTVSVPRASQQSGQGTVAVGINRAGVVVGWYLNPQGVEYGYILKNGHFTIVSAPGAAQTRTSGTILNGIADDGTMSGMYTAGGTEHGFTYRDGVFSPVAVPGALNTLVACISARSGLVVGAYQRLSTSHLVGFTELGGVFHSLRDPLATLGTIPQCGNDFGRVVGFYQTLHFVAHGFLFTPGATAAAITRTGQTGLHVLPPSGLGIRLGEVG